MKLASALQKETTIEETNIDNIQKFSMELNAVAFTVLSKDLYSDPIKSVVREISCNALDAHIEAGIPERPIKISLPTNFDNTFSVRDFGKGLSEQEVFEVYTTFFKSTKRNDNTQIGGFGLGSKSPFAVSESFTVTSYQKDFVRTYLMTKDGGIPKVAKVAERPYSELSDEGTGVEVKVVLPYGYQETYKWKQAAKDTFAFWDVRPEVNLSIDYNVQIKQKGKGYFITSDRVNNFTYNVRIGVVTYPIDESKVSFSNLRLLRRAVNYLVIDTPIGSVTISPNRESLVWDSQTILTITRRLEEIQGEVVKDIQSVVDGWYDSGVVKGERLGFYKLYRVLYDAFGYVPEIDKIMERTFTWGGSASPKRFYINGSLIYDSDVKVNLVKFEVSTFSSDKPPSVQHTTPWEYGSTSKLKELRPYIICHQGNKVPSDVVVKDSYKYLIIDDTPNQSEGLVETTLKNNSFNTSSKQGKEWRAKLQQIQHSSGVSFVRIYVLTQPQYDSLREEIFGTEDKDTDYLTDTTNKDNPFGGGLLKLSSIKEYEPPASMLASSSSSTTTSINKRNYKDVGEFIYKIDSKKATWKTEYGCLTFYGVELLTGKLPTGLDDLPTSLSVGGKEYCFFVRETWTTLTNDEKRKWVRKAQDLGVDIYLFMHKASTELTKPPPKKKVFLDLKEETTYKLILENFVSDEELLCGYQQVSSEYVRGLEEIKNKKGIDDKELVRLVELGYTVPQNPKIKQALTSCRSGLGADIVDNFIIENKLVKEYIGLYTKVNQRYDGTGLLTREAVNQPYFVTLLNLWFNK